MKFLAWHLGLGDAIAFASLAIKISNGQDLLIPCWDKNLSSVRSFFINHPNIHIVALKDEQEMNGLINSFQEVIKLGIYNGEISQLKGEIYIEWIYRQAGEDIKERSRYCPLQKASESIGQMHISSEIIFVHDDKSRQFKINGAEGNILRPKHIGSILTYAEVLKKAKEIHCIDSSFLHLTEALETTGKLFYHQYARPYSTDFNFMKEWEVVK